MNTPTYLLILQGLVAACGGFSCVCVAVGWLIRIVKGVKKPADDVNAKLERDYERLNNHDQDMKAIRDTLRYLIESQNLQIENDQVILKHLRTNNSTGEIAEREKAIDKFLKDHQALQIKEG